MARLVRHAAVGGHAEHVAAGTRHLDVDVRDVRGLALALAALLGLEEAAVGDAGHDLEAEDLAGGTHDLVLGQEVYVQDVLVLGLGSLRGQLEGCRGAAAAGQTLGRGHAEDRAAGTDDVVIRIIIIINIFHILTL